MKKQEERPQRENPIGLPKTTSVVPIGTTVEEGSLLGFLQTYAYLVLRHKLAALVMFLCCMAAGTYWLHSQTPIYRATATIMIDQAPNVLNKVDNVVDVGAPASWSGDQRYFGTQPHLIKGRDVATMVVDQLGLWTDEHLLGLDVGDLTEREKAEILPTLDPLTALIGRITVEPVESSMLVTVHVDDSNPDFALDLVNEVASAYQRQRLEHRQDIVAGDPVISALDT